jgi:NADH:ubiquinone oxidoreductase subunit 2 (subunit N)
VRIKTASTHRRIDQLVDSFHKRNAYFAAVEAMLLLSVSSSSGSIRKKKRNNIVLVSLLLLGFLATSFSQQLVSLLLLAFLLAKLNSYRLANATLRLFSYI